MATLARLMRAPARPRAVSRVPALETLIAAIRTDPRPLWPAFAASLRGRWDLLIDAQAAINELFFFEQPASLRQRLLDEQVEQDPQSWLAVRATYYAKLAKAARGPGVEPRERSTFYHCVSFALRDVEDALQLDASDPSPCVIAVTLGRMAGVAPMADEMYREGMRRAPGCYALARARSELLSARWGGSHAAQLEHARACAAKAAPGSLLAGLPIHAHYFYVAHLAELARDRVAMRGWVSRGEVIAELEAARAASVLHPSHEVSGATYELGTEAALLAMTAGDVVALRALFPRLDDVYLEEPWRQLASDPESLYDLYRRMYGR